MFFFSLRFSPLLFVFVHNVATHYSQFLLLCSSLNTKSLSCMCTMCVCACFCVSFISSLVIFYGLCVGKKKNWMFGSNNDDSKRHYNHRETNSAHNRKSKANEREWEKHWNNKCRWLILSSFSKALNIKSDMREWKWKKEKYRIIIISGLNIYKYSF